MLWRKQNNGSIVGFSKALNFKPINCMPYFISLHYNNIFEYIPYRYYSGDFIIKKNKIAIIE